MDATTTTETPDLAGQLALLGTLSANIETLPAKAVSGQQLQTMADALEVVDLVSAEAAAEWRNYADNEIAKINADAEEGRTLAFRLHRWICKKIDDATAPFVAVKTSLDKKITAWKDAEAERIRLDNIRRETEQREAERQRRERECNERVKNLTDQGLIEGLFKDSALVPDSFQITAAGIEALQNFDAIPVGSPERQMLEPLARARQAQERVAASQLAQQTVHREPIIVSTPEPAKAPEVAGLTSRETWKGVVMDIRELIKAAAENPDAYSGLLEANQTAIDARARAEKDKLRIPGVKPVRTSSQARSRK
jgi:hypothetical protein